MSSLLHSVVLYEILMRLLERLDLACTEGTRLISGFDFKYFMFHLQETVHPEIKTRSLKTWRNYFLDVSLRRRKSSATLRLEAS